MKKLAELVIAIAVLTIPVTGSTQTLTEAHARAVIGPWYVLFNQPVQGDMKTLQEQILTSDYESCWGYLPGECWGRDNSIRRSEEHTSELQSRFDLVCRVLLVIKKH